jgi:phage terminase small subunit
METSSDVELTDKQRVFVDEYLVDMNGTRAAIRAGYSEKSAREIASQNLTKLNIQKAIEKAFDDRKARVLVTQDDVISGLLDEAKEKGEGSSHSARVAAWAHLGKHLNMFIDKVDHTTNGKEIQSGLGHFYGRDNDDGDSDT